MEAIFILKMFFFFIMRLPGIPGSLKHSRKRPPNLIPESKKKNYGNDSQMCIYSDGWTILFRLVCNLIQENWLLMIDQYNFKVIMTFIKGFVHVLLGIPSFFSIIFTHPNFRFRKCQPG